MPTDTKVSQLVINKLTQEQYTAAKEAGNISETELYMITDGGLTAESDIFVATMDETTYDEIKAAHEAGKVVYVKNGDAGLIPMMEIRSSMAAFLYTAVSGLVVATCSSDDVWSTETMPYDVDNQISAHNTDTTAHSDIRTLISGAQTAAADAANAAAAAQTTADGKANGTHYHAAGDITSGTLSSDRLPTVPVAKGGTGATDAATARTNLGLTTENWTFTLEDGSTVTKAVYVG